MRSCHYDYAHVHTLGFDSLSKTYLLTFFFVVPQLEVCRECEARVENVSFYRKMCLF